MELLRDFGTVLVRVMGARQVVQDFGMVLVRVRVPQMGLERPAATAPPQGHRRVLVVRLMVLQWLKERPRRGHFLHIMERAQTQAGRRQLRFSSFLLKAGPHLNLCSKKPILFPPQMFIL